METACTVVVLYLGGLWYFLIFYGIYDLLEYYYGKNGLRKAFAEQNLKLTSTSPFCKEFYDSCDENCISSAGWLRCLPGLRSAHQTLVEGLKRFSGPELTLEFMG